MSKKNKGTAIPCIKENMKDNKRSDNNYLNISGNEDAIFLKSDTNTILKLPTQRIYNEFLDYLRANSPIRLWDIQKSKKYSYEFAKKAIRELEFCHLIYTITRRNKNNRKEKVVYVPKSNSLGVGSCIPTPTQNELNLKEMFK